MPFISMSVLHKRSKDIRNLSALCILLVTCSCKTYQIPVDSFKEQFKAANGKPRRDVVVVGPVGERSTYATYQMKQINVVDKKGNKVALNVRPSLEARFTYGKGKHTTFYFDMIRFNGDTIDGGRSRFLPSLRKKIPISSVTRIDIQDGGKKFNYAN
jgi:hypothetical protein